MWVSQKVSLIEEEEEKERDRNGGHGTPGRGSGRCGRQGSFRREGSGSGTRHAAAPRPAFAGAKELPPLQPFET